MKTLINNYNGYSVMLALNMSKEHLVPAIYKYNQDKKIIQSNLENLSEDELRQIYLTKIFNFAT